MKAEHIEKLLASLGCDKIRQAGNKIRSTCPLAPWKHGGGVDVHPSLAVFIAEGDSSGANCMSGNCGFRGSLSDLVYKMQRLSGRDLSAQLLFISENNNVDLEKRMSRIDSAAGHYSMPADVSSVYEGKDYSDPVERALAVEALPSSATDIMNKMTTWLDDEAMEYLTGPSRRLTKDTIEKWKIGWHPFQRRISVPQFDFSGRLVNLSGRHLPKWPKWIPISDWESKAPKWMHSSGFDRELYLFGENFFTVSTDGRGTVFIAEGAFDVIYLTQGGLRNVAGINGSHINKTQIEKICKWFDRAVLVMDGDNAGIEAAKRIESVLARKMEVFSYRIPDGRDPNDIKDLELDELKLRFQS